MEYIILIIICDEPRRTKKGRPRGGSVPLSIFVNTALPRRASERPGGEGALIKLQVLMIFMIWVRTPVHARFYGYMRNYSENPRLFIYLPESVTHVHFPGNCTIPVISGSVSPALAMTCAAPERDNDCGASITRKFAS